MDLRFVGVISMLNSFTIINGKEIFQEEVMDIVNKIKTFSSLCEENMDIILLLVAYILCNVYWHKKIVAGKWIYTIYSTSILFIYLFALINFS